jgi:hypothetical protein
VTKTRLQGGQTGITQHTHTHTERESVVPVVKRHVNNCCIYERGKISSIVDLSLVTERRGNRVMKDECVGEMAHTLKSERARHTHTHTHRERETHERITKPQVKMAREIHQSIHQPVAQLQPQETQSIGRRSKQGRPMELEMSCIYNP